MRRVSLKSLLQSCLKYVPFDSGRSFWGDYIISAKLKNGILQEDLEELSFLLLL